MAVCEVDIKETKKYTNRDIEDILKKVKSRWIVCVSSKFLVSKMEKAKKLRGCLA